MAGLTYKFTGQSSNFNLQTGNACFNNTKREILLKNFKSLNDLSDIESFKMNIFISNNLYKEIKYLNRMTKGTIICLETHLTYEKNEEDLKKYADRIIS